MSAYAVAEKAVKVLSRRIRRIVLNFANCDMVGHTGVQAAIKAVEAVDECVGRLKSRI